ncbi:quinone-dependent dihydroorotate dehydrogenase [Phragmitibacter flavus]|uniref:Dihydroorotate dehydrogenase (quinone) n=1 Tax=Phragmitibacter flavus TaxID=2576071 RepID=A0A5R8KDD8_9BACT|nr:quinone-dependent dihydroorotate dehydrogenase [Phragmitibacter flavus]TLD70332.1 quinone-dependent dihydroorotate dehydrogenase [Phragmitibacter flavus]
MALLDSFYPILRPLLFQLDAETAHGVTVNLMRIGHQLGLLGAPPTTGPGHSVMGLNFPNLVGLAAGMDKSASAVDAWSALGFGFVEVGTLTPRPQPGNPKPRLFRLIPHEAIINRMGFNNPGIDSAVAKLKTRQNKSIVGVNIGKNFDTPNERAVDDYLICLRKAYAVADYIAVNISSPNTKGLRDLQAEEPIRQLVGTLTEEKAKLEAQHGKSVPLLVKIAPDLEPDQIASLARVFTEFSLDGVIATNTTITRNGVEGHPRAQETGGLSGAPVRQRSTEVIAAFRQLLPTTIPIIGVGGILSANDAREKLTAGAALVQLYSGLVYRGPALVREVAALRP